MLTWSPLRNELVAVDGLLGCCHSLSSCLHRGLEIIDVNQQAAVQPTLFPRNRRRSHPPSSSCFWRFEEKKWKGCLLLARRKPVPEPVPTKLGNPITHEATEKKIHVGSKEIPFSLVYFIRDSVGLTFFKSTEGRNKNERPYSVNHTVPVTERRAFSSRNRSRILFEIRKLLRQKALLEVQIPIYSVNNKDS